MEETVQIAVGALSKHTDTNIETIRYYERVGLLPAPARSSGGYRLYGTDHLKRLNFVRRARALGFSVAEVRKLLTLADQRRRPCAEVRVVAEAHLEDVKAKIADLRRMEHCPMIDALNKDNDSGGRRISYPIGSELPRPARRNYPRSRYARRA